MKIQDYLAENKVAYQTHEHPPAYTAQEVAAEEHVSGKMFAKSVVVSADGKYAVCVLPASLKLDLAKTGKALKAKQVRLADETEMAKLFPDVEVGAEPPFGNLYGLATLVDTHLAADEEIVFQSGSHRQAIRLKYADYARLVKPLVSDLAAQL
jgi:Ala-tRNA(Pro) deacylase